MSTQRQIWQVGAGWETRSYVDRLLRFGVALIGPGDPGPWIVDWKSDDAVGVRSFATEVQEGDVIVLRTGQRTVHAVGLVASEYLYLPQFDDVDGWDLQHARRVRWFPLPKPHEFSSAVFGSIPARFSRCHNDEVCAHATAIVESPLHAWKEAPLPPLPAEEPPLDAIPRELHDVAALAADLGPLYRDPDRFGPAPLEAETVGHFVVPLLRALGWGQELIAIEWRDVDVVAFERLPRRPDHVRFIVEAKKLGAGVEGALGQGREYLRDLGIRRDVLVTDGFRYRLYAAERDFEDAGYANLARLKQGALRLFDALRPPQTGADKKGTGGPC